MRDLLTDIPDRSDRADDLGYLPAGETPEETAAWRTQQREAYLAALRAGLPERLGAVLSWLEDLAAAHGMDAGGDPRRTPADPLAISENDPYVILDDAAGRIQHSFLPGDRDLGWRDGAMLSTREARDLQASMDRAIWELDQDQGHAGIAAAQLSAAKGLRESVALIEQYRVRTQAGCTREAK